MFCEFKKSFFLVILTCFKIKKYLQNLQTNRRQRRWNNNRFIKKMMTKYDFYFQDRSRITYHYNPHFNEEITRGKRVPFQFSPHVAFPSSHPPQVGSISNLTFNKNRLDSPPPTLSLSLSLSLSSNDKNTPPFRTRPLLNLCLSLSLSLSPLISETIIHIYFSWVFLHFFPDSIF